MSSKTRFTSQSLGMYLKEKRLELQPKDVGLPEVHGRRTEGLKQEEVAVLSGVSVSWLRSLENDRLALKVFDGLERVLETLQFDAKASKQLLLLAGWKPEPKHAVSTKVVLDQLQRVVDQNKYPTVVISASWKRLCWNKSAEQLFCHWLGKQSLHDNLMDYMLFDPQSRQFFVHWEQEIEAWIKAFYHSVISHCHYQKIQQEIEERLKLSTIFATHWPDEIIDGFACIPMKAHWFMHPTKGNKAFQPLSMTVNHQENWQMLCWVPEKS